MYRVHTLLQNIKIFTNKIMDVANSYVAGWPGHFSRCIVVSTPACMLAIFQLK